MAVLYKNQDVGDVKHVDRSKKLINLVNNDFPDTWFRFLGGFYRKFGMIFGPISLLLIHCCKALY